MKIIKTITLTPELIEQVQEIANINYYGNFSITVQKLLEKACESVGERDAEIRSL